MTANPASPAPLLRNAASVRRFWAKVDVCIHGTDCDACCWNWKGYIMHTGYGRTAYKLRDGTYEHYAHRLAWAVGHGVPFPVEQEGMHACQNKRCCNPGHLIILPRWTTVSLLPKTHHAAAGEEHVNAKLTDAQVLAMRKMFRDGVRQTRLAKRFSVSPATVNQVVHGKAWKHIH